METITLKNVIAIWWVYGLRFTLAFLWHRVTKQESFLVHLMVCPTKKGH